MDSFRGVLVQLCHRGAVLDAKEHISALADKLGPSLKEIDLSIKSSRASGDASEQDYDVKAEDAVDYEDFDEQYEGPEIQAASEEDYLLPKQKYFSAQVSLPSLDNQTSVFDDENYDDEEEFSKEHEVVENNSEAQIICSAGTSDEHLVPLIKNQKSSDEDLPSFGSFDMENASLALQDSEEEEHEVLQEPFDGKQGTSLPVLCIEDGMVVLRFSEIFGVNEPLKKGEMVLPISWILLFGVFVGSQRESIPNSLNAHWIFLFTQYLWRPKEKEIPVSLRRGSDLGNLSKKSTVLFKPREEGRETHKCRRTQSSGRPQTHQVQAADSSSQRYKAIDVSDAVEEDEEAFLKGSFPAPLVPKPSSLAQADYELVKGDDFDQSMFDNWEGSSMSPMQVDGQRKDSCLPAQPMKDETEADLSAGWRSPSCPRFYPLEQQDWENGIIWGNSPLAEHESSDNYVPSEPESFADAEIEEAGQKNLGLSQIEPDEKDHNHFLHSCNVLVEPFGSRKISESSNLTSSEKGPQILRLELQSRINESCCSDERKDNENKERQMGDAIRRLSMLSLRNKELLEGSWVDQIIWESSDSIPKPKLILDLQDEQMVFEISDNKDGKHLRAHAGAMIITRSTKSAPGITPDPLGQGGPALGRFNISNDKYYSNRKISQPSKSHAKKRVVHGVKIMHSVPAMKLQTMKPKLSKMACIHWTVNVDTSVCVTIVDGTAVSDGHGSLIEFLCWVLNVRLNSKSVQSSFRILNQPFGNSVGGMRNLGHIRMVVSPWEVLGVLLYGMGGCTGREGCKDIANFHRPKALWYPHDNEVAAKEQGKLSTQGPMKIILKSMGGKGSKLHVDALENVSSVKAKASKKLGENKPVRPPGAFKKKSELSVKDGHVFLMEYCEERPLLLGNTGMGARLCTYYQKSGPGDQTAALLRNGCDTLGTVLTLDPADKSPFLGDIKPGSSQSCLETNMYRAPIFPHKLASTDYLLVRSAKGRLSLRRIDKIYVVGQQVGLLSNAPFIILS
ncbi:hypothetical protein ACLOJK_013324 [Asimina triloba]